jgi:pimeloyl-ACP methyl ester carboxylesterase
MINSDWTATFVHYTEFSKGGHFPALEDPEFLAKDVAEFFSKL